ncbi:hypothetical protein PENSPDRAFT_182751 [Peniophora sp. CONT]|nr:hypothetical protein PENSPDRAFT_182751 [Peniophora sp. CONT]
MLLLCVHQYPKRSTIGYPHPHYGRLNRQARPHDIRPCRSRVADITPSLPSDISRLQSSDLQSTLGSLLREPCKWTLEIAFSTELVPACSSLVRWCMLLRRFPPTIWLQYNICRYSELRDRHVSCPRGLAVRDSPVPLFKINKLLPSWSLKLCAIPWDATVLTLPPVWPTFSTSGIYIDVRRCIA